MCCAGPGREAGREGGGRMTRQVTPFHFIGSRKERAAGEQWREGRAEGAEHAVQGFVAKREEDGGGRPKRKTSSLSWGDLER